MLAFLRRRLLGRRRSRKPRASGGAMVIAPAAEAAGAFSARRIRVEIEPELNAQR